MKTLRLPIALEKLNNIKSGTTTEDIRPVNRFYISRLKFDIWDPKPFDKIEYYSVENTVTVNLESIKVVGSNYVLKINIA